jgi:hypothetical protein
MSTSAPLSQLPANHLPVNEALSERQMLSLAQPFENLLITTVNNGPFFVGDLFQRKFAHSAPEYGNPVICFYRISWNHFIPVSYASFLPHEEVILVGGAMTDGGALGLMPEGLPDEISKSGGIYFHVLKFAFYHFREDCEAFFGYAGDRRAYDVDIAAGFEPTRHKHLIAYFHKPLTIERKNHLIEKIHGIGPF